MPSSSWFADFLTSRATGESVENSVIKANTGLGNFKQFSRFQIKDIKNLPLSLSLAVEGGGRQLRNRDLIKELKLSGHGNWRKNHLGAFEACLGKKPFFHHIEPFLKEIYLDSDIVTLKEFNAAIFRLLVTFSSGDNIKEGGLGSFYNNPALQERGKEIAAMIDPEDSSIVPISDFGKESLLGFLAL